MTILFVPRLLCDCCPFHEHGQSEPLSDRIDVKVVRAAAQARGWRRVTLADGRRLDLCPDCADMPM